MKTAYIVSVGKGLESFIYREIEQMLQRNIEVSIFATKYNNNDIFSPKKSWDVERINVLKAAIALIYFLMKSPILTIRMILESINYGVVVELFIAFDYARRIQRKNIHHIHCHFGDKKYFIGYFCKKFTKLPLSLTVHAHELFANPNERFFKKAVHFADKIIAISQLNKEILMEKFQVQSSNIEVIRLSVDLQNFKREEKIKVLTVARYTERKGFQELFEAIKLLNRRDVEFITVGFGDLNLQGLSEKLGIKDNVTIFNKMSPRQLKYFYNTCDIFCLPSKTTKLEGAEGIPVVLMEAMASEMIIVTTPNGSIAELVDEILVEENNTNSLVEGLLKAIELVGEQQRIGAQNRSKVLTEYSEKNIDVLKKYLYE